MGRKTNFIIAFPACWETIGGISVANAPPGTNTQENWNLIGLTRQQATGFTPVGGSQSADLRHHNCKNKGTQEILSGGNPVNRMLQRDPIGYPDASEGVAYVTGQVARGINLYEYSAGRAVADMFPVGLLIGIPDPTRCNTPHYCNSNAKCLQRTVLQERAGGCADAACQAVLNHRAVSEPGRIFGAKWSSTNECAQPGNLQVPFRRDFESAAKANLRVEGTRLRQRNRGNDPTGRRKMFLKHWAERRASKLEPTATKQFRGTWARLHTCWP